MKKKFVVLGSGGLSIGQAGEFDYSGTQAVNSLLEDGHEVIIINPNIATVQTQPGERKKVYLYPVEALWVEKVFAIEKPFGILAGFGGQTALNCLIELEKRGSLKRFGVINMGTSIDSVLIAEDRQKFSDRMRQLKVPTLPSKTAENVEEALSAAESIGYPIIGRAAFTLGGLGGGFANSPAEMMELANRAYAVTTQLLIEKSLKGWREVEYEVMRDSAGNAICICNMENLDPLGIHTGDSIVVAPSQTLTDNEYQTLRDVALKIVHSLNIIGECNVQFALSPTSSEFYVIEINPRLSRSSALASKATGYPIAHIAAKVVTGKLLTELKNPVTQTTSAFFEPALDYLVVKIPRWDLRKFDGVSRKLGSSMKSVGEVMAIGKSFCEALQKAVRMASESSLGLLGLKAYSDCDSVTEIKENLSEATDTRIYAIAAAFRSGMSLNQMQELTMIDRWFLAQIQNICLLEKEIAENYHTANREMWLRWKRYGFSDEQIAALSNRYYSPSEIRCEALKIRKKRKELNVIPYRNQIDTAAAEFPSSSNYFYFTYWASYNDESAYKDESKSAIILGSGPYNIGTSLEFDWCAVTCSQQLRKKKWNSIVLNCNPETVSTDYSISDKLYFDEISVERILDIQDLESTQGVIVSMGGQLPNRLAAYIAQAGLNILGHSVTSIEMAENRKIFSDILDRLDIKQPQWIEAHNDLEIESFIKREGFPVLIRPSFVLSGTAMSVANDTESLNQCLKRAKEISIEHPVVISKYLSMARELEYDGVASNGEIVDFVISEHIENAGVHSGDASLVVPAQSLNVIEREKVKSIVDKICKELHLNGAFNVQFLLHNHEIFVIECNVRASRSMPFVSKVTGHRLIEAATNAIIGEDNIQSLEVVPERFGVKAAVFSFSRLLGSDPIMGVEMYSTGEVGAISSNFSEALLVSFKSANISGPKKGILISSGPNEQKDKILEILPILLKLNIPIYATPGTAAHLERHGVRVTRLSWPESESPDCLDAIRSKTVDMVINIPKNYRLTELNYGRQIRQCAIQNGCSLFTNFEKALAYFNALELYDVKKPQEHMYTL